MGEGLKRVDRGLRDVAVARGLTEAGIEDRELLLDLELRGVGLADRFSASFFALLTRMLSVTKHGLLLARARLRVRCLACGTTFHGLGLTGGDVLEVWLIGDVLGG